MNQSVPKLWNRNFTILTLGSVVSMMGNTIAGFAISLLVLEYTESTMLYTLYIVCYNLPKLVMPVLAGPYLDAFSRRKAIYVLDYISSGIYLGVFLLLSAGLFSYVPFLFICILIGAIDSVYLVAYDSLYPTLVDPSHFRKAYSISSVLGTLSTMVAPVVVFFYDKIGSAAPLFACNAVLFFLAATMETQIKANETHLRPAERTRFSLTQYKADFQDGLSYIRSQPGLMVITMYFFLNSLSNGPENLVLPYFKSPAGLMATGGLGVKAYVFVQGGAMLGRFIGGSMHYRFKLPAEKKFSIALFVYIAITFIHCTYLLLPSVAMMCVFMFFLGLLGVTSYNIRISSTQSYVPNSHRARFNGTFQMLVNLGAIGGQLIAGALGEFIPIKPLFIAMGSLNLVGIFFTMVRKGKHVKPIYNMDV